MSCDNKEANKNDFISFFPDELSKRHNKRNIIDITAEFNECGEWGGSKETIYITTDRDEKFHLAFIKYDVDCDSMVLHGDSTGKHYYAPLETLVDSVQIIMNNNQLNSIITFSQSLLISKYREKFPGHAGNRFLFRRYDGFGAEGFTISNYSKDSLLQDAYLILKEELKLSIK